MKKLVFFVGLAALTAGYAAPTAFNLGSYKDELAKYAATEADQKVSPLKRARAKMSRLVLEMQTCEDAELEAKIAETRAFIEKGGELEDAQDRVEFCLSVATTGGVFEKPDAQLETLAAEAAKVGTGAARTYVRLMLGRCHPKIGSGSGDFTYEHSYERALDILDAALKNPLLKGSYADYERQRFSFLLLLGRRDEAFRYAEERVAATKESRERRNWYLALAKAYRADARRYADKPAPELLKKSEEMLVKAASSEKDGLSTGECLEIARMRLLRDDCAGAREFVLRGRAAKGNKDPKAGERLLGDIAFAEEKWSEAADLYLPFFDAKGRNDHALTVRTVEALFGANRRAEAVPLVKWLSEEQGRPYRQSRARFAKVLAKLIVKEGETLK